MTHLKNSTSTSITQLGGIKALSFLEAPSLNNGTFLLETVAGVPAADALDLAATLSGGIHQLTDRLYDCINDGAVIYCDEMRALGFLAETVNTLVRAVQRAEIGGAE